MASTLALRLIENQWAVVSGQWPVRTWSASDFTDHWPPTTAHFFTSSHLLFQLALSLPRQTQRACAAGFLPTAGPGEVESPASAPVPAALRTCRPAPPVIARSAESVSGAAVGLPATAGASDRRSSGLRSPSLRPPGGSASSGCAPVPAGRSSPDQSRPP